MFLLLIAMLYQLSSSWIGRMEFLTLACWIIWADVKLYLHFLSSRYREIFKILPTGSENPFIIYIQYIVDRMRGQKHHCSDALVPRVLGASATNAFTYSQGVLLSRHQKDWLLSTLSGASDYMKHSVHLVHIILGQKHDRSDATAPCVTGASASMAFTYSQGILLNRHKKDWLLLILSGGPIIINI